jgi:hypothetical protein
MERAIRRSQNKNPLVVQVVPVVGDWFWNGVNVFLIVYSDTKLINSPSAYWYTTHKE